jgi:hypothetical protein
MVLISELLQELADDIFGNLDGSRGRDGRWVEVEGVHISAGGQDIGVTDRVPVRSGHQELTVEKLHDSRQLVVSYNLLQAKFNVGEDGCQSLLAHGWKTRIYDCLSPRLLRFIEEVLDRPNTTVGVR